MMMSRRRAEPTTDALPLLVWREEGELARMEAECVALQERIARLPRHAHYRIALETRLKDLRTRQLRLAMSLRAGHA